MKITFVMGMIFYALAQFSYAGDSITIENSWAREVSPGSSISAVYMTIKNSGDEDKLVGISSDISESAELHSSKVDENGIASMEMIKVLNIPPGETIELNPGGMHIMLIGLKEPLVGKDSINLKLKFENSGEVMLEVPVMKSNHGDHNHNH